MVVPMTVVTMVVRRVLTSVIVITRGLALGRLGRNGLDRDDDGTACGGRHGKALCLAIVTGLLRAAQPHRSSPHVRRVLRALSGGVGHLRLAGQGGGIWAMLDRV